MQYDPRKKDHGLPHDPFLSLVVPRPIGWISTVDREGVINLAPYSFFNAVCGHPPMVMFASSQPKHSRQNVEETGEFVASLVTFDLSEAMNLTSTPLPQGVSEPAQFGLEMEASAAVTPPRVKAAASALECVHVQTVQLSTMDGEALPSAITIGQVVSVHIDDRYIADGRVNLMPRRPIARLGYMDYGILEKAFTMIRPGR